MDLHGARVLITGSSKGIGELTARSFAARGARVALAARSGEKIKQLATELGGDAYQIDLADAPQVEGFVDRVEADGTLDVLVNNAGLEDFTPIEKLTAASIDHLVALNLATPLKLTSQMVSSMLPRRGGHIVQVSSMAAVVSTPGSTVYSGTKAALSHATACLELELRNTGISLTTVHLGGVDTEMGHRAITADTMVPLMKRFRYVGLAKLTDPRKVADSIVRAVEKEKRFVVYPANAAPMAGLVNLPRRTMNAMSKGITFH